MNVFTETEALVELSMRMVRVLALGYVAVAITQCLSGVMRGAGDTITPMWISLVSTVILRVPTAYGLAYLTRSPPNIPPGGPSPPLFRCCFPGPWGPHYLCLLQKGGYLAQKEY